MAAIGQTLSFLVVQFRILIDDTSESRFSDVRIAAIFNVAELDVLNDVRRFGWRHNLGKISDTDPWTIKADTQEISIALENIALIDVPYLVRRAETNNTSIVPIMEFEKALVSQYPAVYFRFQAHPTTPLTFLGYYRKVVSDMKFTIYFFTDISVDFNQNTYAGTDTTDLIPKAFNNLLLYKALALAETSDTTRASIFDARYNNQLDSISEIVGSRSDAVVDVYNDCY